MTAISYITLLVDDNAVQAATRKTILERAGQSVVVAADGLEAMSLLDQSQLLDRVGLIITDHSMPGMNGPEFVQEVRAILPSIPVLILTGLPNAEDEYIGMDIVFRSKPFPPDALIALTRDLLSTQMRRTA